MQRVFSTHHLRGTVPMSETNRYTEYSIPRESCFSVNKWVFLSTKDEIHLQSGAKTTYLISTTNGVDCIRLYQIVHMVHLSHSDLKLDKFQSCSHNTQYYKKYSGMTAMRIKVESSIIERTSDSFMIIVCCDPILLQNTATTMKKLI